MIVRSTARPSRCAAKADAFDTATTISALTIRDATGAGIAAEGAALKVDKVGIIGTKKTASGLGGHGVQAIGGAGVKLRDTAIVGNAGAGVLAEGTGTVSIVSPSFVIAPSGIIDPAFDQVDAAFALDIQGAAVLNNGGFGVLVQGDAPAKITQSAVVGTRGGAQQGADGLEGLIGAETGGGDGVVIEGTSDDGEASLVIDGGSVVAATRVMGSEVEGEGKVDDGCACPAGTWGPKCLPCACGDKGTCDEGKSGTGACACAKGFTGPSCDVCSGGFDGAACDSCKAGFYGPACIACACGDGQSCNDGKDGDGGCSCLNGFVDVDGSPDNGCGTCNGGSACDDGNPCAVEHCSGGSSCVVADAANGTECGGGATCQAGVCSAGLAQPSPGQVFFSEVMQNPLAVMGRGVAAHRPSLPKWAGKRDPTPTRPRSPRC